MKRALALIAAAALVAGCGSSSSKSSTSSSAPAASSSSAAPASASATVQIKNFLYAPASISVKVGGTVKWTNQDSTEHTATPDSGSAFDTGTLTQNKSKAIVFKTPGTFAYHCVFHAYMHGSVVVTA